VTLFRPCIDLHAGQVKQIVGGSLRSDTDVRVNFSSDQPPGYYSELYRRDGLLGGHVIALGAGNQAAAEAALGAWPDGMQFGGGVTADNAAQWLALGASKVIVTSYLFEGGKLSDERLQRLARAVPKERLVIDLSCRRKADGWFVATDRWQVTTDTPVDAATLTRLSGYCSEFLVHAADVEGLCQGIDEALVVRLGEQSPLPCTYAGGGKAIEDLSRVEELSQGRVDLTFGSALDLFGGSGVRYADCVAFNRARQS
jgi:phosphoribosylformimino-5-aminoimidazole carboxamide ribotide isomerase